MAPKVSEEYKIGRKKELVEISRDVFIQNGFVRTSMQDIMDKAKISRGSLYSYFNNIEDVFLEVLKLEDKKDISFFAIINEGSIWIQLKNWIEEQRLYIEKIDQTLIRAKAEFFLSSNYVNDKDNYPYISERYNRIVESIEEVLIEGTHRGEFSPQQSTRSIAQYFISFIDGLMLDSFQLGQEQTKVNEQLSVLLFTLQILVNPKS